MEVQKEEPIPAQVEEVQVLPIWIGQGAHPPTATRHQSVTLAKPNSPISSRVRCALDRAGLVSRRQAAGRKGNQQPERKKKQGKQFTRSRLTYLHRRELAIASGSKRLPSCEFLPSLLRKFGIDLVLGVPLPGLEVDLELVRLLNAADPIGNGLGLLALANQRAWRGQEALGC